MGLGDWLTRIIEQRKFKDLDQGQNEALVRALVGAVMADGAVAGEEQEALEEFVSYLDWDSAFDTGMFIGNVIEEARGEVVEQDNREAWAESIAAKIQDAGIREEIYYMAARIVGSDEELLESERAYLSALVQAFEIPGARQQRITERLINEGHA